MNERYYGVGIELLENGVFEPLVAETIVRALRVRRKLNPDKELVVVDAGANIGIFSVLMARHILGHGTVYAYEPQHQLFQVLCGNILLNNLHNNLLPFQKALGNENKSIDIPVLDFDVHGSYGSLSLVGKSADVGQTTTLVSSVDMVRIDSQKLLRVDLIKIDVEGGEFDVLVGAQRSIIRHKPIIICETGKSNKKDIVEFLSGYNYKFGQVGSNDIIAIPQAEAQMLGLLQ
jgi:FkbM family methyltransferase